MKKIIIIPGLLFILFGLTMGSCIYVDNLNPELRCEENLDQLMLYYVNQAWKHERFCGDRFFPAPAPLTWNDLLTEAAEHHSQDMADHDYFGHVGPAGDDYLSRVTDTGYAWVRVGENIAGGFERSQDVVEAWLTTMEHCSNIMDGNFTEMGTACSFTPGSTYGTYWTLVLARPVK